MLKDNELCLSVFCVFNTALGCWLLTPLKIEDLTGRHVRVTEKEKTYWRTLYLYHTVLTLSGHKTRSFQRKTQNEANTKHNANKKQQNFVGTTAATKALLLLASSNGVSIYQQTSTLFRKPQKYPTKWPAAKAPCSTRPRETKLRSFISRSRVIPKAVLDVN